MKNFEEDFLLAFNVVINDVRYPIFNFYSMGNSLVTPLEMLKSVLSSNKMINALNIWNVSDKKVFPCFANLTDNNFLLGFNDDTEIPQKIQALIGTSENIAGLGNVTYQKVKNNDNSVVIENMSDDELRKLTKNSSIYKDDGKHIATELGNLKVNRVTIDDQGESSTYIVDVVAILNHFITKKNTNDLSITDKYELPIYHPEQKTITFATKYSVIPVYTE